MKLDVIPNLFRNLTVDKTLKQVQGDKNYLPLNRIAGLLTTIFKGDIANVLKVLTFYASLSSDWNSCKPDVEEFYMRDIYS